VSVVTDVVRWVVLGRTDGVRASIRARLGVLTWVDRPHPDIRPVYPVGSAAPAAGREGWARLLASAELGEGQVIEVVAGDRTIALSRVCGAVYALDGVCAHAAGPLGEGHLADYTLTCPVHGWSYDVRTGVSSVGAQFTVRTYRVAEEGGAVWLVP
jgi:nitrite reductase (NADH) small subunit